MTKEQAHTAEEQLQRERRQCSRCGYDILNPLTDRCPRCFNHVERTVLHCGSCTWQGSCEFAYVTEKEKNKS
jgi:predicted amidophosphoribosyltransferase